MKTVYIFHYSQLTKSNILESIQAFATCTGIDPKEISAVAHEQGGSPLHVYTEKEMQKVSQGAIYLFKTGKISETEFVSRMNKAIGIDLSFEVFKECWNKMCLIKPDALNFLRQLEKLQQKYGFGIHVMSNSNTMHINYIYEQLEAAGIKLETSQTFSFEAGILDPELPKNTDPKWSDCNLLDFRGTTDILEEINKIIHNAAAPKPRLSPR